MWRYSTLKKIVGPSGLDPFYKLPGVQCPGAHRCQTVFPGPNSGDHWSLARFHLESTGGEAKLTLCFWGGVSQSHNIDFDSLLLKQVEKLILEVPFEVVLLEVSVAHSSIFPVKIYICLVSTLA